MPPKRKKYQLGEEEFATKADVKRHCQEVLAKYDRNATVNDKSDHAFLEDLLSWHPSADEKIGQGVESFSKHGFEGNYCFHVNRVDGTSDDFSFNKCITNPTPRARSTQAFRKEIQNQIDAFFESQIDHETGLAACALTGQQLPKDELHVDHEAPLEFSALLSLFVDQHPKLPKIDDAEVDKGTLGFNKLKDRQLAAEWQEYHKKHAKLRLLSKEAHKKETAKRYKKK